MKYLLSLSMALFLFSCSAQDDSKTNADGTFTDVTNAEAKALMEEHPNLQIIDVRTDGEVAAGIIEGAQQIDISSSNFESELEKVDKSAPVLVYCASGGRSSRAQKIMRDKGFKEVHNLAGGYSGWEK